MQHSMSVRRNIPCWFAETFHVSSVLQPVPVQCEIGEPTNLRPTCPTCLIINGALTCVSCLLYYTYQSQHSIVLVVWYSTANIALSLCSILLLTGDILLHSKTAVLMSKCSLCVYETD
ncbi:hypothetical protein NP493_37g08035 [Ridgeia piscesae]|uniref:Uncharacterized protein n=1 Tax=Ridgeia piscesae TaxID=27915 RepID=A0AAD9PCI5_RIDPI|nr:hypothetical protein NP493_37g08035 [Ridgeia piscesae]